MATTAKAFDTWAERKGIHFVGRQREVAHAVLESMIPISGPRANGKTFVLETVDRFLSEGGVNRRRTLRERIVDAAKRPPRDACDIQTLKRR